VILPIKIIPMQPRSLSRLERMLALTDAHHPLNVVVALRLLPAPPVEKVRPALDEIQRRHPELRARLETGGGTRFFYDVRRPIPLSGQMAGGPEDWVRLAEQGLNTRLDSAAGPLMRCTSMQLPDGSGACLVFAIHHAIVDASSLENILHEFLLEIGGEPAPEEVSAPVPAVEARFPAAYRGFRGLTNNLVFALRQLKDQFSILRQGKLKASRPLPQETACQVFHFSLDERETENLVRAARRHGVTLHTTLQAAMALVVDRMTFAGAPRTDRMMTFADLRPYLHPPLAPGAPGSAFSMLPVRARRGEGDRLWALAKRIHPVFTSALRRGDKFAAYMLSERIIRMVLRYRLGRVAESALSYTGPIRLSTGYGPYRLEAVHAFISNNRFGPSLSAQARLFRNRLWVDGQVLDTETTEVKMQEMAAVFESLLKGES